MKPEQTAPKEVWDEFNKTLDEYQAALLRALEKHFKRTRVRRADDLRELL